MNNFEDWSNFIYLSFLLIYLISSVIFKSHIKASQLLKQFMGWVGIALISLILYSFRHEVKSIKNRVVAELFPSNIIQVSDSQIGVSISEDGHFYIDIKINNIPIKFLVDTGASNIILSLDDAERIGINTNDLNYTRIYNTANGKVMGAIVNLAKIEVAGVIFKGIPATINNSDLNISLLGMSFLNRFKEYEFYQDKLILTY